MLKSLTLSGQYLLIGWLYKVMKIIWRVPKYFSFNCGPKWSIVAHWEGYGLGIRHEYTHIRIMLIFWHMVIFGGKYE